MKPFTSTVILLLAALTFTMHAQTTLIWSEDFENGWGNWWSDEGIWDLGSPTVWPDSAYAGTNLVGTYLSGNYPYGPDSRLISPSIVLPSIGEDEEILLRFQQIFNYSAADRGYVQIQTYNADTKEWSEWSDLDVFSAHISRWHNARVVLSEYSGQTIRLGFFHQDATEDPVGIVHHYESFGWYLDHFSIIQQKIPIFSGYENFENGAGGWYSEDGIWNIGSPSIGPDTAFSGSNLMGTVLDGNYLYGSDSRLVSPRISLPEISDDEEIELRFQQFFNYASSDYGKVQVQVMNDTSKEWSDWTDLDIFRRYITNWHYAKIDLSDYAGNTIRIGFLHTDKTEDPEGIVHHSESTGWYIDDFTIITHKIPYFTGFEDFEGSYSGWFSQDGIWEIGTPATQPDSAYSGKKLAGTVLKGNYLYGPDSRLVSPRIILQEEPEFGEILLRYQQYYNFAASDYGDVQIQTLNPDSNEWSEWTTIKHNTSHVPDWHHARIDISEYAGDTVRIGFFHVDNTEDPEGIIHHYESIGWFIDDVSITGVANPIVISAGEGTSICSGEEVILGGSPTISNLGDNQRIAWDASEYLDDTTKLNPVAMPLETITFQVHLIEGDNILASDEITVEVKGIPQADAGNDQVICSGESAILGGNPAGSSGTPPFTYQWEPMDIGGDNETNPEVVPAQEESEYILEVTDSNGCANKDTVSIISESADITLSEPDTIHSGEAATFKIFGNMDNLLITIEPEPDNQQYFSDKIIVNDTPSETTSYAVTATTKVASCTSSESITIVVLPTSVSSDIFESISVYPVPAHDKLHISSPTIELTELEINTLKGEIVFQTKIESNPEGIDISSLPPGFYMIQLKSFDKSYRTRFIKR